MPLIQGGPPEWIWERTPDPLVWEVVPSQKPHEHEPLYELKVKCGLGIMRLQFFTDDELQKLQSVIDNHLSQHSCPRQVNQPVAQPAG